MNFVVCVWSTFAAGSYGRSYLVDKEFTLVMPCTTLFAAACMTWDLAESGEHFITTVINGSDLVPTFSAASVDDLRSEVQNLLLT